MYGSLEQILLEWQVLQQNSSGGLQPAPAQQDLAVVAGVLQFQPGVTEQGIILDVIRDGLPELSETFRVELVRTTGGSEGARLGLNSTANLVVSENDDPYGVFSFTPSSENIEIGEDIPSSDPDNGTGVFYIQRSGGSFNSISVSSLLAILWT